MADTMKKKSRLRYFFLIGFVYLLGVCFYFYFWFARLIGSEPAEPTVPSEPFEHVWHERKVLLLDLGDSVAAGFDTAAPYGHVARLALVSTLRPI